MEAEIAHRTLTTGLGTDWASMTQCSGGKGERTYEAQGGAGSVVRVIDYDLVNKSKKISHGNSKHMT